ncbi:hypothetical protein [Moheibacter lacus]|uniref:DUF2281 domain-containing protein n=1 Tax=Moheibacter lacus TaxID=2745851 RepID=A0A838ZPH5_9FLAO|nr:hypothetical protein [Moheibacter lacus]MBA5629726.1 hypothetical protein [Moheibacter lacus]
MSREILIENAIGKIKLLPESKIQEINDFVDFLLFKIDEEITTENIQQIVSESSSFDFLNEERELYNESDLKIRFK